MIIKELADEINKVFPIVEQQLVGFSFLSEDGPFEAQLQ
jgi:hypothetical protein